MTVTVAAAAPAFAAIDLGASSARLFAGELHRGALRIEELVRLRNGPVYLPDGIHWDLLRVHQGMLDGLGRLTKDHAGPMSVGIDGWGVDYGLLDRRGHLLGLPFHYRDTRTDGRVEEVEAIVGPGRVYEATGVQTMAINTLYQLMAERGGGCYDAASQLLLVPDLMAWFLTGVACSEPTNMSTTQMVDVRTGQPVEWLLHELGLRQDLFAEPVLAGEVLGPVMNAVAASAAIRSGTTVVAVGTHDTASAVLAVPALTDDFAYVVSGTWSLVGVEMASPVVNEVTRAANFSNEVGVDGTIRFLRNVAGHWILQECERVWALSGEDRPFPELLAQAARCPAFRWLVDTGSAQFANHGDMPALIREACRRSGGPVPSTPAEVVRCTVDSLALALADTLRDVQRCSGRQVRVLHVVGGGSANELLLRGVASASGMPVVAGPVEASAVGNILMQMRAAGLVGDRKSMRELVARSFPLRRYDPEPALAEAAGLARDRLVRAGVPA